MKRYAVSPVDALDIKKGKRYLISNWSPKAGPFGMFNIDIDIEGEPFTLYCLVRGGCAHIKDTNWTIIEEKEPSDG